MIDRNRPDETTTDHGPVSNGDIPAALQSARNHFLSGDLPAARQLCLQLLEADPGQSEALNLLGLTAARQGEFEEAEAYFRRASQLAPEYVSAHINLGKALQHLGRSDEAIASFESAMDLDPTRAEIHNNLGVSYRSQGRVERAMKCFRRAVELAPAYASAQANLGITLRELRRMDEAVRILERAAALDPTSAEIHNNLGIAYQDQGRVDQAMECYRRAIELAPNFTHALGNLGNALLEQGRFEEAAVSFRTIIKHQPDFAEAHYSLARVCRHTAHDDEMKAMEALLSRPGISDEQRTFLHFGLGKAFEDIGIYEQAFAHLAAGCRLKRSSFSYDIDHQARHYQGIKETFDTGLFKRHPGSGCHDSTPVFIVGMPRSGTTLTEQILASHPQVNGAGELYDLQQVITEQATRLGGEYPGFAAGLTDHDLQELGAEYVKRLKTRVPGDARHITDKMPLNFMYVGLIRLMLPAAKIIHCKRDAADTCLSCFKLLFTDNRGGTGHRYSYDLTELGRYYRLYEDLMRHWHRVLPGVVHDLEYEALLADPEGEVRRLLEFCGLPWHEACLNFHASERAVKTASAMQVRRPLYKDSMQRWRLYEPQLKPLLAALGRA